MRHSSGFLRVGHQKEVGVQKEKLFKGTELQLHGICPCRVILYIGPVPHSTDYALCV